MKQRIYPIVLSFFAGLILGVVFMVQVPAMLAAQRGEEFLPNDMTPTAYEKSPRSLDVAILGRGYFQFDGRDGSTLYSRESSLYIDAENTIVGKDGLSLSPAVRVPENADRINISEEGIVSAWLPDEKKIQQIGQIELALFPNSDDLAPSLQEGYFEESIAAGPPKSCIPGQGGTGALLQGYTLLPFIPVNHPKHLMTKP
ncbi:MAG: hypothetical protein P9L94_14865 [Candidatus Hinthialibacter antarcticus]|nr:hypothetical protein [Candidatus Hinthialibacter antarcticus]